LPLTFRLDGSYFALFGGSFLGDWWLDIDESSYKFYFFFEELFETKELYFEYKEDIYL